MSYNVYFACDNCGVTISWVNFTVNFSNAVRLARGYGWQVGKKGWYCPNCRKQKKKEAQQ